MIVERLRLPDVPEPLPADRRQAAVAAVFGPDDRICLIRRSEREGDPWSGHIAFPGGRREPHDPDLRATAVRETHEEVGLDLGPARLVGVLSPQLSPRVGQDRHRPMVIVPYVFGVERWGEFALSGEVDAVHLIEASRIFGGEGRSTFRYRGHGYDLDLPCVHLDGAFIWGMTLRMLDELAERLA